MRIKLTVPTTLTLDAGAVVEVDGPQLQAIANRYELADASPTDAVLEETPAKTRKSKGTK